MEYHDATHGDRLQDYRGRFQERIGDFHLRPWIFVLPDLPLQLMDHGDARGTYSENCVVQFPRCAYPGIYVRHHPIGTHWILRFDEHGNILALDDWNSAKFLIKGDDGHFLSHVDFERSPTMDIGLRLTHTIALRLRSSFGFNIPLLEYTSPPDVLPDAPSPRIQSVLNELASLMARKQRFELTHGMVHHLARNLCDQLRDRGQDVPLP